MSPHAQRRRRRAPGLCALVLVSALAALLAASAAASEGVDQVLADLNTRLNHEQEAFALASAKARSEAVRALELIAHRAKAGGDAATAAEAWTAVLRLERTHGEANAFFTDLGQLDAVLKRIDADEAGAAGLGMPKEAPAGAPAAGAAAKPRHVAHAALIQQPWEAPFGGMLAINASRARELQFSGGGTLDTAGKIALLPLDLGSDWVLTGDVLHLGTACAGFIVAYDPASHAGTFWYAESDRAGAVNTIDGPARTRIAEAPLGCPLGSWLPFTVARKDNQVQITIADKRTVVTLPAGHQGGGFGLVTFYKETAIGLANLALTLHPR
jgi:hypothetical protein